MPSMSIQVISKPSIVIPVQYSWTPGNIPGESPLFGPENEFGSTKFRLRLNYAWNKFIQCEEIILELVSSRVAQVDVYYKIEYNKNIFSSDQCVKLEIGKQLKIGKVDEAPRNTKINCQLNIVYPYKSLNKQLATDLETLRKNPLFTDIVFVVGNKEFPAHKNILSARSPVFETMFKQQNFVENQSNRIEVIDIESNVLEGLLEFVYTGEVKELVELAADLLVAAHKYQIDSLVKRCESNMTSSISIENASKYLKLADMYSLEELKTKALTFINSNIKEVMQTEGWKVLIEDNLVLMKDLYKNLAFGKE